jgi:hypothetical protein
VDIHLNVNKEVAMSRSRLILLSLFALVLLAAWSPACAANGSGTALAVQAVQAAAACQPALNLAGGDNACRAPAAIAPANQVPEPEFMANKHLGYCHCGCGPATCRTSADCGGASCDKFISCC